MSPWMAVRDHSLHLRGLVRVGAGGSSGGLPEKEGTMGFFVFCHAAMSARELFVGCARSVARVGVRLQKARPSLPRVVHYSEGDSAFE